ncbi:uncharacterized protein BO97DRAFT_446688 [Aspergillus homomorphus CBS 101889]|uniref:Uncharacterized protein n=1 Tax=Aspergillus homomorphus (strain CBS 101889) TaxID=1450537 RepID=A0A395HK74_ASPHC|nr:hypothetical protein BO97DRAFT_446688 [Aspergillus homomorphus CBS 101889]RAL07605.1 hypothetical protein BO97DRAFT_446688 [Aspergillus homomorphus CBS 101889]
MSSWSPETIVALVALLVTAPSSLLVIWKYYRRHRRYCSSPQTYAVGTPLEPTMVNLSARPATSPILDSSVALEAGLSYRDIFVEMHVRQMGFYAERG